MSSKDFWISAFPLGRGVIFSNPEPGLVTISPRPYLKVSLEEVLIALRDDAQLLADPDGMLGQNLAATDGRVTLYPEGFSAGRFVEVIHGAEVWWGLLEAARPLSQT